MKLSTIMLSNENQNVPWYIMFKATLYRILKKKNILMRRINNGKDRKQITDADRVTDIFAQCFERKNMKQKKNSCPEYMTILGDTARRLLTDGRR